MLKDHTFVRPRREIFLNTTREILLYGLGALAGVMLAIQSVLNSTLGQRVGNFGSVLILTIVGMSTLILLIILFPSTADFKQIPTFSEWHLYIGGILGIAILIVPIVLVPKIGTTSTLIAIVLGQMAAALLIDHFGIFASPKIELNLTRVVGIALVTLGAFLVGK